MKARINNFREQLLERTLKFSEGLIKALGRVPKNSSNNILTRQAVMSGTSIGANYREACEAESAKDFVHKIKLCKKESRETNYWLELVIRANPRSLKELSPLKDETIEFTKIFSSISAKFNR